MNRILCFIASQPNDLSLAAINSVLKQTQPRDMVVQALKSVQAQATPQRVILARALEVCELMSGDTK